VTATGTETRPAFYALARGGWRDYVTLLHPPYTLWHLSYVAIGAALAPHLRWGLLGLTVLAFLLAMGVGAHALDELHGRPLETRIPARVLTAAAALSIAAAVAIGVAVAAREDWWLLAFVGVGAAIVIAYNLELAGGLLHGDLWFALDWGAFPALTAYFAQTHVVRWDALAAAGFAALASYAQRVLSTQVRDVRRRVSAVTGTILLRDGRVERLDAHALTAAPERALKTLAAALVALAGAMLLFHVV
jgi:hypothetical protein